MSPSDHYIAIQTDDFSVADEHQALRDASTQIGAIVTFTGLVREFTQSNENTLYLEHYPTMTEKVLMQIIQHACQRWEIKNVRIIHRIGHLSCGDQIVFVGVNSAHRSAAFLAGEFIMDFLKIDAPFWKKEGGLWLEAKQSDEQAKNKWSK
jgi:molybdopterin synthase catalytic subunit